MSHLESTTAGKLNEYSLGRVIKIASEGVVVYGKLAAFAVDISTQTVTLLTENAGEGFEVSVEHELFIQTEDSE